MLPVRRKLVVLASVAELAACSQESNQRGFCAAVEGQEIQVPARLAAYRETWELHDPACPDRAMILAGDDVPAAVRTAWFCAPKPDSVFVEGNFTIRVERLLRDGENVRLYGKILDGADITPVQFTASTK